MCVSLLGDGIFTVAMAWQVYELSNVPTALSIVSIALAVPWIICLVFGGVVADRFNRRKVIFISDVTRGLALAAIAALSISGLLEIWHMVALVGLYGAGQAFFGPAFDAIVPDLVPPEELPQANSLDQMVRPIMFRLAGPALGGLLIAVLGVGYAFAADAGTFAFSAVAVLVMRSHGRAVKQTGSTVAGDIKVGFNYIRKRTWLWATFASAAIAYLLFMGPTEVLLPYIVKNDLNAGAGQLGLIFAVGGVASVAAAIAIGQTGLPKRDITWMYITWTIATLAIAGYGLGSTVFVLMVASMLFNGLETVGQIIWSTAKQRHVPPVLLGRVSSLDWLISIGLLPVSFALTGPTAAAIGAQETMVLAGILGAAVTLAALFLPGMRAVEGQVEPAYETESDISPRWGSPSLVAGPLDEGEAPRFTREPPAVPQPTAALEHSTHSRFHLDVPSVPEGGHARGAAPLVATGVTGAVLALLALILLKRGPLVAVGIVGATVIIAGIIMRGMRDHEPEPTQRDTSERKGRFTRETPAVDAADETASGSRFERKAPVETR
jgi:DHA3 family tetracycline resistance protein-like MFS transporter